MDTMKVLFPALMVVGALGSLIVNIMDKGWPRYQPAMAGCVSAVHRPHVQEQGVRDYGTYTLP